MEITKECETCKEIDVKNKGKKHWKENRCFITIDSESTNLTCGVKGMTDCSNIQVTDGKVFCSNCNTLIYQEKENDNGRRIKTKT